MGEGAVSEKKRKTMVDEDVRGNQTECEHNLIHKCEAIYPMMFSVPFLREKRAIQKCGHVTDQGRSNAVEDAREDPGKT